MILNKKRMNYKIVGEGKPLVFLHSYLWTNEMWEKQVEVLSKEYKCIFIELWGHGESQILEKTENYSLEALTEDVISLVDHLNIDKFTFIGLSVGGMVGCHLGVKYADRLEKLVIMDSYIGIEPEMTKTLYFSMLDAIGNLGFVPEELAEKIAPMFFSKSEGSNKGELYKKFKNALINLPKENINTIVALGRGIFGRKSILEELGSINVPTLIVAGEDDIPRPFYESEEMHKLIKNSELCSVKNAGHISVIENPEDTNKLLLNFLKK